MFPFLRHHDFRHLQALWMYVCAPPFKEVQSYGFVCSFLIDERTNSHKYSLFIFMKSFWPVCMWLRLVHFSNSLKHKNDCVRFNFFQTGRCIWVRCIFRFECLYINCLSTYASAYLRCTDMILNTVSSMLESIFELL